MRKRANGKKEISLPTSALGRGQPFVKKPAFDIAIYLFEHTIRINRVYKSP
jgi:hypothetical protein